jgi:hypothetical protein
MSSRRLCQALIAFLAIGWASNFTRAPAVSIVLDYSYDSTNFFGAGNPGGAGAGALAKSAIEATAAFYSSMLTDTLSAISKPADFHGSASGSVYHWNWSLNFSNPTTGAGVVINNSTIAADAFRIYVGARELGSTTLGFGGPGGAGYSTSFDGPGFTPAENAQIATITNNFISDVTKRGETTGFAAWGGAMTFDSVGTTWHYNHTTAPTPGSNDFFSVAIHEMAHVFGLGASAAWQDLATGATFSGLAAKAAYGGVAPPLNTARDHWASGTNSVVFGTATVQEAAMDPEVTQGTRKRLTALDAGALTDIGWSVAAPSFNSADFNLDGTVNGPDLAIWKTAYKTTTTGNADGDGDTDGNDFLIWQRRLGHVGAISPNGSVVPEPASAAMLLGCAILSSASRICRPAKRRPSSAAIHIPMTIFAKSSRRMARRMHTPDGHLRRTSIKANGREDDC